MTEKKKALLFLVFCFLLFVLAIVLALLLTPQDTSRDEVYQRMKDKAKIATINKMVAISIDKHYIIC